MKNESLCFSLLEILQEAEQERGMTFDKTTGNLLYRLGAQCPASALSHRPLIAEYVGSKKISAVPQLEAALEFVERLGDRQVGHLLWETNKQCTSSDLTSVSNSWKLPPLKVLVAWE